MIPDMHRPVFDKLVERTLAGDVNWRRTVHPNRFVVVMEPFSISIIRDVDPNDGAEFVRVGLINDEGRDADGFSIAEYDPEWRTAVELHQAARHKADRLDVTLDHILSELDKQGPIGTPREAEPEPEDDLPF